MAEADRFYEGPLLHMSNMNIAVAPEGATFTVLQTSPSLDGRQPTGSHTRPVAQFFATPAQMSSIAVLLARMTAAWVGQHSPNSHDDFLAAINAGIAEGRQQGQDAAVRDAEEVADS
jgi:hypothetical protein